MKEIAMTQGFYALVDDEDFESLNKFKWFAFCCKGQMYVARSNSKGRSVKMHRHIMAPPKGMEVDHIDGNGLNNQKTNLRLASRTENMRNSRIYRNNTSGFKGVSFHKGIQKYAAYITHHQSRISIGYFHDPISAAKAYDAKAIELFGEFAKTNKMLGRYSEER